MNARQYNVLVVDDTKANIDILVDLLADDYEVSVALDGEQALEAVAEEKPDIILLDVMMPGMDGYEVCKQLKQHGRTHDIPIIFVTAKDEVEDEAKGLDLGAIDYVAKPISPPILLARVKNHLELKTHRDNLERLVKKRTRDLLDSRERLKALELAQEVQQNLLPDEAPCLEGLDVAGRSVYCDETGGDYFDFYLTPAGQLVVIVADVCGHGVAASLLMASTRGVIKGLTQTNYPLDELLQLANTLVCEDVKDSGRFVTLLMTELDPNAQTMRWANAGHEPAFVYSPHSGACRILDGAKGPLLGLSPGLAFPEHAAAGLAPGEILVCSTDGVWETINEADELFGMQRFQECVARNAHASACGVIDAVLAELEAFRGKAKQLDDVTLAVVKATGQPTLSRQDGKTQT